MEFLCPWDAPTFFGLYSENVPLLLYYSHVPAMLIALFLGIAIFFSTRKTLATWSLLGVFVFFASWNLFDLFLWATNRPDVTMFFWSLQVFFEVLVFALAFCFVYSFISKKELSLKLAIAIALPIIILAVLTPTAFNLTGVYQADCIAEESTVAKYLSYALEAIALIAITVFCMERYRKVKDAIERKKIMLIGVGTILFLLLFIYGNLIGSFLDDWEVAQYGLFGSILFMASLSFLIVRFKAFNIKVLATQALVWGLWALIGSELFFVARTSSRILVFITLLVSVFFGIFLIKSVKREVSQRLELETKTQELATVNEELTKLDEFRRQVLSFASHDLKSPIALMKQWASLIYDGTYADKEKVKDTAFRIKMTADRAVNMVESFLDVRKMEEGKMEYNFEQKNIVEFAGNITKDFEILGKQKNIEVSFTSKAADIKVAIDTNSMRQVLQNLLDNSLKYTETGSIAVTLTEEQKSVLIKIQDTGVGMQPDVLPTLFEQFHRDPNVAKKIKGTGLGLYISKQIVLAHHGEIWAESDGEGKGSRFLVRLPKA